MKIAFIITLTCIALGWAFYSQTEKLASSVQLFAQPEIFDNVEQDQFLGGIQPVSVPVGLDPEKVLLGRELFQDKLFSANNSISCSSCHDLEHGGADHVQFSVGIHGSLGSVNSPTVFNSALNFKQFWDGRAATLAEQIEGPIHDPKEMGSTWAEILEKLKNNAKYSASFKKIYGGRPDPINVTNAFVEFEKSLVTLNAPFDRYLRGEQGALTEIQISGYQKFSSFGCISCHQGKNVGGNMFQTLGITGNYFKDRGGSYPSDQGRFSTTKLESDLHVFKVPSLRNVALTAPYFHDGTANTLQEAVRKMAKYQLGRTLTDEDVNEIVAFLNALTGELPKINTVMQNGSRNAK